MTQEQGNNDSIEVVGVVTHCLSNATFRVFLPTTTSAIVQISGKLRRNYIRVLLNDRVKVELSGYDLTRGRITHRFQPGETPKDIESKDFFNKFFKGFFKDML